jgi:hypothetical protein
VIVRWPATLKSKVASAEIVSPLAVPVAVYVVLASDKPIVKTNEAAILNKYESSKISSKGARSTQRIDSDLA